MEIENYRPGAHPVIGTFDVYFGDKSGMRMRNLKIVMSKKGTPFHFIPELPDRGKRHEKMGSVRLFFKRKRDRAAPRSSGSFKILRWGYF